MSSESDLKKEKIEIDDAIQKLREVARSDPEKAREIASIFEEEFKKEKIIDEAIDYTQKLTEVFNRIKLHELKESELETYINAIKQDIKKYVGRFL